MAGDAAAAHLGQVALAEHHRAATRALGELDQLEQGALAGARMPGDEQHLAGIDRKAHLGQRHVPAGVGLADIVEAQDRHRGASGGQSPVSPEPPRPASAARL